MIRPFLVSTLLATTFSVASAQAQDATPTPEAQTSEAPAETTQGDAAQVLDTGEAVADGTAASGAPAREDNTYVRETSGDWDLQCLRVEEGPEPCQMYQLLKDSNGANVAEVSLFKVEGGGQVAAGGTFVAPLETLLTQKLSIGVDSGPVKRYDFSFCTQVGCFARVGFTAEEVAAFKAGNEAKIAIVPALAPDQRVLVTMSLKGFTAAYDQITSLKQ
ncbi:invasion associated locus B family protein [Puniceibacterium sp. IMCC21224]|uniref:invasion associated locus B family protein n=1 Tax=Puniceibacterium sp. IMCC21224 TaxID=1618204 RepID=UPI00064DDF8F|nr:invasion associated locus B family protein [Puniceibacterium sp. IMCC21224]KMK67658.1 Invasion protein B, involved in pathogenesis [Puniceibacterium sp. IMCC21224]